MHRSRLPLAIILVALGWPGLAVAQAGSDQEIPDFSGGWARIGEFVENFEAIPGYDGSGPMAIDPVHPHADRTYGQALQWIAALDNPILKPETLAKLEMVTEAGLAGIPHVKDEGMCQMSGVPMLWNRRSAQSGVIQMLQTPGQVTILNARDHQVRIIYLDVPHSDDTGHSWYGESVGHYEGGNTLVVDTIGQNDKTQIDRFGTTHSDKIHVTERLILSPDGQTLEVQFTVEDPIAFTMPWSARVRHENRPSDWDEQICAENNRFIGQVTVAGEITRHVPMPTDTTPDF